jgi:hypothetical protein
MQNAPATALLASASTARAFITAGNATVTLKSKATGAHFTFKVRRPDDDRPDNGFRFVSLMNGPDNTNSFAYIGYLKPSPAGTVFFHGGAKARAGLDAPGVKAWRWAWQHLVQNKLPEQLEVWHEGRCGRCARKLTHPASIASGFGPECAARFEAIAA